MVEDRNELAALLRRAAAQTIPESEFWAEFNGLSERIKDPVVEVALESATHDWGNFHQRSVFSQTEARPTRTREERAEPYSGRLRGRMGASRSGGKTEGHLSRLRALRRV